MTKRYLTLKPFGRWVLMKAAGWINAGDKDRTVPAELTVSRWTEWLCELKWKLWAQLTLWTCDPASPLPRQMRSLLAAKDEKRVCLSELQWRVLAKDLAVVHEVMCNRDDHDPFRGEFLRELRHVCELAAGKGCLKLNLGQPRHMEPIGDFLVVV
jgi:hypothetical protein